MPFAIPRSSTATRAVDVPLPEPGWLDITGEGIGAAFEVARSDTAGYDENNRDGAYHILLAQLVEQGQSPSDFMFFHQRGATLNRNAIFQAAQRAGLPGLPGTMEAFEQQSQEADNQRIARLEQRAARDGLASNLIGGIGGAMMDPLNQATLFVGPTRVAGSGLWGLGKYLGQEALLNMAVEGVQQPLVALRREQAGRRALTLEDALTNVGFAGAGAVALGGAGELAAAGARRIGATDFVQNRAMLSEANGLRFNPATAARQALEANDPGLSGLSQRELDALLTGEREIAIANANLFPGNGGGQELHNILVGDAWARAMVAQPFANAAAAPPAATAAAPQRVRADGGEPDFVPRTLQGQDAQQVFMDRVRGAESGGDDAARNPRSSATGRYQFTDGTWLAFYRRRYGTGSLSDAQILARRGDGRIQDQLMADLTAENSGALRGGGEAVTPGNLYLAHFAGSGGALKVLRADPDADLGAILGGAVIDANPFLRGKTADWLVRWAADKMNSPVARRGGARITFEDGMAGALARNAEEAARLQDALDSAVARADELAEQARAGNDNALSPRAEAEAAGWEPVFVDFDGRVPDMADAPDGAPPPEIAWLLPRLDELARQQRGTSLNRVDALAKEMGATPAEMRAALDHMVEAGRLIRRSNGMVQRKPNMPARDLSLAEFIANRGGMIDIGGELRGMDAHLWHTEKPFRNKLLRDDDRETSTGIFGPSGSGKQGNTPDGLFEAAIEAGYFPEFAGQFSQGAAVDSREVPDIQAFYDAISNEIRGNPRYAVDAKRGEFSADRSYDPDAEERQIFEDNQRAENLFGMAQRIAELAPERMRAAIDWDEANEIAAQLADGIDGVAPVDPLRFDFSDISDDDLARHIAHYVNTKFDEVLDSAWYEVDDARYDFPPFDNAAEAGSGAEGRDGRAPDPGDTGEGGAGAGAGAAAAPATGAELARLPEAERTAFIDPDGDAAKAQADSLEHDARAAMPSLLDMVENQLRTPDAEGGFSLADIREYLTDLTVPGMAANDAVRTRAVALLERLPAEPLPEVPAGHIRMWHGGMAGSEARSIEDGGRWFSSDRKYAAGYGNEAGNKALFYVDVPETHPLIDKFNMDEFQNVRRGVTANVELPADIAMNMRQVGEAAPAARAIPDQTDFAAPTQDQARIALERKMEGRSKGTAAQKPPGSDGGLFDVRGEDVPFRFGDEGGSSLPDMLKGIEDEATDLKNIRDCL